MVSTLLRLIGVRRTEPRPAGYLTWAEIEAKYPDEWVLVDFQDQPRVPGVPGGWVIAHGADREPVAAGLDHAPEITFFTVWFTGRQRADEPELVDAGRE